MVCRKCGWQNSADAIFCAKCGRRLTKETAASRKTALQKKDRTEMVCRKCGWQNSADAKFCARCSQRLNENKPVPVKKYAKLGGAVVLVALALVGLLSLLPEKGRQEVPARENAAAAEYPGVRSDAWKDNVLMLDRVPETIPLGGYKSSVGTNPVLGSEALIRYDIGRVVFEDTLQNAPGDRWDVSEARNGSVVAWAEPADGALYELHIAAEGGINGKNACEDLFCGYANVTRIDFNGAFHTEEAENFSRMFYGCQQLTELDLSGIRTDNAVSLSEMFAGCFGLTALDVSGFQTSEVEDTSGMFSNCWGLRELDITGFDLYSVRDVSYMFYECPAGDGIELILDGVWFRNVDRYTNFMDEGVLIDGEPWINLFEPARLPGASEVTASPSLSAGDIVLFGSYEQDNDPENGRETIAWVVLDTTGDSALLLSAYALDSLPYNTATGIMTWEDCSLRKWLNEEFLYAAFSAAEREKIVPTYVSNSRYHGNSEWDTDGGDDTMDNVFLLSYVETGYYFPDQEARICEPTEYAVANGADVRLLSDGVTEAGWWWLRSPGENGYSACFVNYNGDRYTNQVSNGYLSVRPALWVRTDNFQPA